MFTAKALISQSKLLRANFKLILLVAVAFCNIAVVNGSTDTHCDIKWRIFHSCDSREYEEYCIEDTLDLFKSKYYKHNLAHTVFIAIPFLNDVSHWNVRIVVEGLASRCLFNIVVIDNSIHTDQSSWFDYVTSMLQVYEDSKRYAKELNKALKIGLLSSESIIAIGYSLGAQIVGQVCRGLDQKCSFLYAVEPAGPFYIPPKLLPTGLEKFQLVSTADACNVVSLICNAGFLGTMFQRAHVNIIVNNGILQPKCLGTLCAHEFCNKLLVDAIRRPNSCLARRCGNYLSFRLGRCDKNHGFRLTFPPQTSYDKCEDKTEKTFFIQSSRDALCNGINGSLSSSII